MNWLHNWLGISTISSQLEDLKKQNTSIRDRLIDLKKQQATVVAAAARVLAKIEAGYTTSEFDPARKVESDKLAEETIRRLEAEAAARAPYND